MKRLFRILFILAISVSISQRVMAGGVKHKEPPLELVNLFKFDESRIVEPVSNLMPYYPPKAFEEKVEAEVWIRFRLDSAQLIDSVEVIYCDTEGFEFEEVAIKWACSRKFLFKFEVKENDFGWWYTKLEYTLAKWHWKLAREEFSDSQIQLESDSVTDTLEVVLQNRLDPVDKVPELTFKPTLNYPERANLAELAGVVYVLVLVSERGLPLDVRIHKSCDPDWKWGFNEAAISGAKLCRFKPAIQNGEPVKVWVTFPFMFRYSAFHLR